MKLVSFAATIHWVLVTSSTLVLFSSSSSSSSMVFVAADDDLVASGKRHPPIDVVEKFLIDKEIANLQSTFHVDHFSKVYGYGQVDVPNSLVERVEALLKYENDLNNNDDNNTGTRTHTHTKIFFGLL